MSFIEGASPSIKERRFAIADLLQRRFVNRLSLMLSPVRRDKRIAAPIPFQVKNTHGR